MVDVEREDVLASKAELDTARQRLLADQRQMLQGAHGIDDDLRSIEEATRAGPDAFDRAQFEEASARLVAAAGEQLRNELSEIQSALVRVVTGGYGSCLTCGRPIAPKVLEDQPAERHCEVCSRREEARAETPVSEPVETLVEGTRPEPPPDIRDLSDEDVEELVKEELTEVAGDLWRGVDVSYRGGVVALRGEVESADHRQVAEQIVADRLGLAIVDELEVMSDYEGEGEDGTEEPGDDFDREAREDSEDPDAPFLNDMQGEVEEYDPAESPLPMEKVRRRRPPTSGL